MNGNLPFARRLTTRTASSYCPNLVRAVDVALLTIGVIDRLDPQVLIASFAFVCEPYELWVVLTSATTAQVLAEDDDDASASDTHCIDKPD